MQLRNEAFDQSVGQMSLPLDGYCNGPLFAPPMKRRAPKRPPGSTTMPGKLRRAAERRATPSWADTVQIGWLYDFAAKVGLSVDHIVPLQHPLVCGLHVEHNLQLLPLAENLRKGNTHWPDMWEQQQEIDL